MEKFTQISHAELQSIINKKEQISQTDRFKLQTYCRTPLADMCNGLTNEELKEVWFLESKNIFKVINAAGIVCGVYPDLFAKLKLMPSANQLISAINEFETCAYERSRNMFTLLIKWLLAEFDLKMKAKFTGKMPQKLFQFRQQTGETWFDDYVNLVAGVGGYVYASLGTEEAMAYVLSNTAYYLNSSQTFKYYRSSSDKNMDDTIYRIITLYLTDISEDKSLADRPGVIFYKDL